jgi:hypothetical protein
MKEEKPKSEMHAKIEDAISEVKHDPRLAADHKEALIDMLIPARIAVNGAQDKIDAIANAVGAQSVYLARRDRHHAEAIERAIVGHVSGCPLAKRPKLPGVLCHVYPFRWPLAVIIMVYMLSPYVGPVMAKLTESNIPKIVKGITHE